MWELPSGLLDTVNDNDQAFRDRQAAIDDRHFGAPLEGVVGAWPP